MNVINFEHIQHLASIINFEHVNAGWDLGSWVLHQVRFSKFRPSLRNLNLILEFCILFLKLSSNLSKVFISKLCN